MTLTARFTDKTTPGPDGCILWTAATTRDGYGHFGFDGRMQLAHRVAWESEWGPIPDGLQIDHLCRVRRCVNPDHLEPVTSRENILRGVGVTAINAAKTHCQNGHPFDEANTYHESSGRRRCLICRRAWDRKRSRARRARTG